MSVTYLCNGIGMYDSIVWTFRSLEKGSKTNSPKWWVFNGDEHHEIESIKKTHTIKTLPSSMQQTMNSKPFEKLCTCFLHHLGCVTPCK